MMRKHDALLMRFESRNKQNGQGWAAVTLQTIISNNRQIMLTIIVFSLGIVFLAGSEI